MIFHTTNLINGIFDIDQFKKWVVHIFIRGMCVSEFSFLNFGTVSQHHAGNVGSGGGGKYWPLVTLSDEPGQPTNVIVVSMRKHNGVESGGVKEKFAIQAAGVKAVMIVKTTVEQYFPVANFQKVRTAGHLPCRTMKRDPHSDTSLPPILASPENSNRSKSIIYP